MAISAHSANEETFTHDVLNAPIPVLVHFWAPWCGLCRMIEPLLAKLAAEWGGQLRLISVNADENLKLANAYQLKTLPTLVLFDGGVALHRLERFHSTDDLRLALGDLHIALERLTMSCML
ncbi:MAG: thioredoxin family protein [Synechococcales bacterium]|nr:thioredoxin family protein [Synechococcales bacterium]